MEAKWESVPGRRDNRGTGTEVTAAWLACGMREGGAGTDGGWGLSWRARAGAAQQRPASVQGPLAGPHPSAHIFPGSPGTTHPRPANHCTFTRLWALPTFQLVLEMSRSQSLDV